MHVLNMIHTPSHGRNCCTETATYAIGRMLLTAQAADSRMHDATTAADATSGTAP
jgi:hypothetical protein